VGGGHHKQMVSCGCPGFESNRSSLDREALICADQTWTERRIGS